MTNSQTHDVKIVRAENEEKAVQDMEASGLTVVERTEATDLNGNKKVFLRGKNFNVTQPSPGREFAD